MKLAIVIATAGRRALVSQLLRHLEQQTRPPAEVVISAPDETHADAHVSDRFPVTYLFGSRGLCAQRNRALDIVLKRTDVITFFDDDFLPGDRYLEHLLAAFVQNPGWAVISGNVVVDGARGAGLSFDEGLAALRAVELHPVRKDVVTDHVGAYGCNMSVRTENVGTLRFDERLVLYGWQEDIDFTSQLTRHGRIVSLSALVGVHLGAKGGRSSGVRLGYSQIVNPTYLVTKGTMPVRFAAGLMCRNFAANLIKSVKPEPHIDRRGRLRGNLTAFLHLMRGRVEPEYILRLPG